jgi:hypothetical protein
VAIDDAEGERVIRLIREELSQLLKQRAEIMRRIVILKQTLRGLTTLFGTTAADRDLLLDSNHKTRPTLGMTEICRLVLTEATRPLTPREVVQKIHQGKYASLLTQTNPESTVNTILTRLVKYGEARPVFNDAGQRAYQGTANTHEDLLQPTGDKPRPIPRTDRS